MPSKEEKIFQVIPVSPGIAIGKTLKVTNRSSFTDIPEKRITEAEIEAELNKFHQAADSTRKAISDLKAQLNRNLNAKNDNGGADIFDAHLMILDDHALTNEVEKSIREKLLSADYAFFIASEHYAKVMEAIPDPYLSERAMDVRDVANRFLNIFYHNEESSATEQSSDRRIVIAKELTPSETALLDPQKVLGFAVESGSSTSHTAILARSMQMPAVVDIPPELFELSSDSKIIIDGYAGRLIINPKPRTLEAYQLKAAEANKFYSTLLQDKELLAETTDGFLVQLGVNLEKVEDAGMVKKFGGEAVGLFRTEMLFLKSVRVPSEDEQFEVYKTLLTELDGKMTVIRTLDIGGDKLNDSIYRHVEQNPFLGLRGIRLCLKEKYELFRTQLRALLRAGVFGNLKIMLPMITTVDEVHQVRMIIEDIQNDLRAEKIEHLNNVSLGAMIETPAAALLVNHIAPLVDFFSIGTNDLVQYTMSIDRSNEKVNYLYQPGNPAILELIARTAQAARNNNIWVSVCGQMAGDPLYVPLLLGLGINELSMAPSSLSVARRVIRSLKMCDAENLAYEALHCSSETEVNTLAVNLLKKSAPEIADLILLQNEG